MLRLHQSLFKFGTIDRITIQVVSQLTWKKTCTILSILPIINDLLGDLTLVSSVRDICENLGLQLFNLLDLLLLTGLPLLEKHNETLMEVRPKSFQISE